MEEIDYSKLTKVSSADNKTELHQCRDNPVIAKEYVDTHYIHKDVIRELLKLYKPDMRETFIVNHENHILLAEKLEMICKEKKCKNIGQ